ncbi:MAG: hypothetical protein JWM11_3478, partial [Planctomycetaceae bacterium]|nr:hypothetical protein [Planctomycetaceae bacterium]
WNFRQDRYLGNPIPWLPIRKDGSLVAKVPIFHLSERTILF